MNFTAFLPTGLTQEDALVAMAALAALVSILAVWSALLDRDRSAARAAELMQRYNELKSEATASRRRSRQAVSMGFMRQFVVKMNLLRSKQAAAMGDKLAQAGWRSRDALVAYLFAKVALPLAFGAAVLLVLYTTHLIKVENGSLRLLIALGAVVAGAYAPDIFVKNAAEKRKQKLRKSLPDVLDLMVVCAEAGLSLDAAMKRVAKETQTSAPEMSDELGIVAVELGFMPERRMALENLLRRTDLKELRAVVGTLLQTEKYGTPLAQALRVLAAEQRDARLLRAEDKAARLPATLTVPMVVFILPCLFIVLIGPAILRTIDALSRLR